jgi:hypothetical protein
VHLGVFIERELKLLASHGPELDLQRHGGPCAAVQRAGGLVWLSGAALAGTAGLGAAVCR